MQKDTLKWIRFPSVGHHFMWHSSAVVLVSVGFLSLFSFFPVLQCSFFRALFLMGFYMLIKVTDRTNIGRVSRNGSLLNPKLSTWASVVVFQSTKADFNIQGCDKEVASNPGTASPSYFPLIIVLWIILFMKKTWKKTKYIKGNHDFYKTVSLFISSVRKIMSKILHIFPVYGGWCNSLHFSLFLAWIKEGVKMLSLFILRIAPCDLKNNFLR